MKKFLLNMKNKNILEVEFLKKIDCSKDVAFWNYWDHEHLDIIHTSYNKSDILYDENNFMFRVDKIKLPIISFFKITAPIFMVQKNENTLITHTVLLGVMSKTTITIKELSKSSCEIAMNYKFYLDGWRKILKPFLKIIIPKWNESVWLEDYPVKIRRQKILDLNCQDFKGLPNDINSRKLNNRKYNFKLPIPRPKNSTRDRHPLSERYKE